MSADRERWARLESLFSAALELPAAERGALLSKRCGADPELRAEVERMIEAHDRDRGLAIESRLFEAARSPVRGRAVGQYRLAESIGRGGMGEVFLAERADAQYEQRVAVKLLRPGLHAAEMVSRFERERQILARLEHPNIATLLDGGVDEDGRPYLVMQYVDGEPITGYCDRRRLGIELRLRLFATVCRAVQFSHANLVVHRDLKPSNILVTEAGELKLLDFGIAKLLDPEAGTADATRAELRLLTPERAAPEQLRGEPATAAVDVYALGILLCELLTGRTPHRFPSRDPLTIARIVDAQPPPPPSTLLRAGSGEEDAGRDPTPEEVSKRRGVGPERLRRLLAGELDRIVLMALRREPERRYLSAAQLGDDVERYLAGEPVLAHADSRSYRARKFLQRNRLAVSAAALLAAVVLGFGVLTAIQNRSIAEQRDRANAERDRAEAVVQMLTGLFETADPVQDPGRDRIAVTELLERGEARVEELEGRPETRARMLLVLGQIHAQRSRYDKARELLERARDAYLRAGGSDDSTSLTIDHQLALVARRQGDFEQARPALAASLDAHRRFYGTKHPTTAEVMADLALALPPAEQRPLLEEALAIRRELLDPRDPAIASSLNGLAIYHHRIGDLETARRLYREALDIMVATVGEKHPHTVSVLGNLADVLEDPEERIAASRRVVELRQEILPDSVETATAWNNLGVACFEAGRRAEAREAWERSIELYAGLLGADDWRVGNTVRNVGLALELEGRYEEALTHLERALAMMRKAGADDLSTGVLMSQRAQVLARLGRTAEALEGARRGVEIARATTPAPTAALAACLVRLGRILLAAGSPAEAEAAFREAGDLGRVLFGAEDPRTLEASAGLGRSLAALEREEEARPQLIEAEAALREWPMADPLELEQLRSALEDLDARELP